MFIIGRISDNEMEYIDDEKEKIKQHPLTNRNGKVVLDPGSLSKIFV